MNTTKIVETECLLNLELIEADQPSRYVEYTLKVNILVYWFSVMNKYEWHCHTMCGPIIIIIHSFAK